MAVPENATKLGTVGIAYKGVYNELQSYKYANAVYYNGSTYIALIDNPAGFPSNDGVNWRYLAQGFLQQAISALTVIDESGILGEVDAEVNAQEFLSKIAELEQGLEDTKANKADILDSLEEIVANTEDGRIMGAKAASKLTENLENLMTYSTEGHIVGKWLDGKDLYEVTLLFDSPAVTSSSGAVTDSHDISSLGKMSMVFVESAFYIRQGSTGARNAFYQLPFKNANNKGIWVSHVKLEKQTIDVTADDENFKYGGAVYVTLRYTKE